MSDDHLIALPVGFRLQEYRIDQVLGQGGFGITYLATDMNLDKRVAIKEYLPSELAVRLNDSTVRPKSSQDTDDYTWGLERFLDEAKTLARFRHDNLVPVHRFFEAHSTAYMVMEYEAGESLADYIRSKDRPVSEASLRSLLDGVLDGLEVVHAAGYLHRDIKPQNIIIRPDGTPVLIDFGAARQSLVRKSRNVTSIVTPGYAPLEQYTVDGNQGPWSDIYAMAAVAYQAITGAAPPEATMRVKRDPYVPLATSQRGRFTDHFLQAIDWALTFDEEKRPQDVPAWRTALSGQAAAQTMVVKQAPPAPVRDADITRQPTGASGPQRVLAGADGGIKPAMRWWIPALIAGVILLLAGAGGGVYYLIDQNRKENAEMALQAKLAKDRADEAERLAKVERDKAAAADRERQAALEREKKAAEEREKRAAEERDRIARQQQQQRDQANQNPPPVVAPSGQASDVSKRAAADAKRQAEFARAMAADARTNANDARNRGRQAREDAAAKARAASTAADARTLNYQSGAVYKGPVANGKRQGYGVLTTTDGYRYEGQWVDDAAEGLGTSRDGKGDRYEGQWKDGHRGGTGVYFWSAGDRYEGQYAVGGKRTGRGVMYYSDGYRSEGQWVDGEVSGLAVMYLKDGERYEGEVLSGKRNGRGIYYWPSGQRFEGNYRDDKRTGYGVLTNADGTTSSGYWSDGRLERPD